MARSSGVNHGARQVSTALGLAIGLHLFLAACLSHAASLEEVRALMLAACLPVHDGHQSPTRRVSPAAIGTV